MRALVLTEYKRLQVREVPEPAVAEGDVLVRVHACGICGSDVHGFDGSTGRRIPPLVMGHEAAGEVVRVGSAVRGLAPGDRVTFDSTVSCGRCDYCRQARTNLCDARRVMGVSCGEYRQDGAYAEYVSVPAHIVYPLPAEVPFEHAAMVELVSVAVHAVGRVAMPARTAVVVGAGTIGLLVIQALRAAGTPRVIAIDVDDGKLSFARRMGAEVGLNPTSSDVPAEVRRLTEGGADVALECVGATAPIETAIACVRKGGAVVLVGNVTPVISLPLQAVVAGEITLRGTCASSGEYPRAIELLRTGAIDVGPLITEVAPLEEGPAMFDRLHARERGLMKVVLQP
jgi:2-desacetyl-2-hydroxyethyl bacteriochlorophyllide A dehydrogenase